MRLVLIFALLGSVGCGVDLPNTTPTPMPARGTPARVELSASSGLGANGGTARIQARVQDAYFATLPDVAVTFAASAGTFDAAIVRTDDKGIAVAALTADPGTVKVTAAAGGVSAPETQVTIQPVNVFTPPPPGPVPPPPLPDPKPQPPTPPQPSYTVALTATPSSVVSGAPVTLAATVTPLAGAPPVTSWSWDCDTSTPSTDFTTANSATCTYATAASFTAGVKVTGAAAVGSATTTVTVTAPPVPSYTVTVAASPATIAAGGSSTLTATVTRVNGAPTPTAWAWDCDSSTPSTDFTSPISATCTYPTAGIFIAKVTATNGSITSSATVDVNVTAAVAPTPVVTVHCAQPVPPALTVNCNVTATLNGATVGSGGIVAANWDFGDQVTTTSLTNASTHTYAAPNTYTVLVTNISVPGTTVKGTGSASIVVQ